MPRSGKEAYGLRRHMGILVQNRARFSLYGRSGRIGHACWPTRTCIPDRSAIQFENRLFSEGGVVQLDDHLKQLLRELGHAINDTVSESSRITDAISEVRAAGFEIVLKLDATIGLARRDGEDTKITPNDRRFLESLHIQVDQEILTEERQSPKFEMTPQDLRFLKSLKITFDDAQ
jgi:hypothetical protein